MDKPVTYPARLRARSEVRDAALRRLGYRDYKDYLSSPEWMAVRIRFRNEHGEACGLCGTEDDGRRDLHHMTYERVGEEYLSDLVLLCSACHHIVHVLERRGEMGLDFSGLADFKRAAQYAAEREARSAARERFGPSDWSPEDWERAITVVNARLKQTVKRLPRERGKALMADVLAYAKELELSEREGRPYRPAFEESGLDFSQPPQMVIAQLAGGE